MKDLDLEMQRLTMDDSDDYDEYEEEFIDRDEEYEVDDDEEAYDDEEYEDEDYGDEEYDDYEEDYDDGYDDGYDDSYYDERLNKVLDELAELKRAMANPPAVQNNQPSYTQPTIPYVFAGNIPQNQSAAPAYNGEVLMYNEISRLRDELSKTQNSQNLHVELNRLKDEMERTRQINESQYLAEIKRLNDKVETLQKNSLGPQGEDEAYLLESRASEGAIGGNEFNKLISINESILQNSRTADSHMQNELSDIKKKLAALDSEEFGRAVSAIRKLSKGINAEDMSALAGEIGALKNALSAGGVPVAGGKGSVDVEVRELKEAAEDKNSDNIVLLKKIAELRRAIGYNDDSDREESENILALMNEFLSMRAKASELSLGDSLYNLNDLEKKVSASKSVDAVSLGSACDSFASELLHRPLDKKAIEDLIRFADDTAVFSINREKREALDKYSVLSQRLLKGEDISELLPQLLEVKAKLQDSLRQSADETAVSDIKGLLASGADNEKIKEAVAGICTLRACDFVRYPRVAVEVAAKEDKPVVTLMEKADNILSLLGEGIPVSASSESAATEADGLAAFKEEIIKLCSAKQLDDAVAELKSQYVKIVNALAALPEGTLGAETASAVNAIADEAQYNNNELSDQMYNIRDELNKAIHDENLLTQDTLELKLTDITDAQRKASDDLEYIKQKLSEAREVIDGVSTVRETVTDTQDATPVSGGKLYDDLCEQFDKLYEDLSTLLSGTETNVIEKVDKLNENVNSTMETVNEIIDSINANIDNINALVSGVNTSLDGVNNNFDITNGNINNINNTFGDSFANVTLALDEIRDRLNDISATDVSVLLTDSITELRMAVDDFIAKATAYDDAALNDRLKLLDDVAYIRSRSEEEGSGDADALAQMRDDIMRDLNLLTDTVSGLNIDEMRDNVSMIKDTLDILAADTSVGIMGEDLAELKESSKALAETVNNSIASTDGLVAEMREDLSYIRSRLDGTDEEGSVTVNDVYDVLAGVNEKLDSVTEAEQQDAQTLLGVLEDIKEQLHLKELEPSIEGVTDSEEEKQTLLNEIAEVRERLAGLENVSQGQSDSVLMQLTLVSDELNEIKEAVSGVQTEGMDSVLGDISEKLDAISQESALGASQLPSMAADIAEIKSVLTEKGSDNTDGVADMMQTVNDMSDRVKDFAEHMELAALEIDSIPLVLSELGEVKQAIAEIREKLAAFDGAVATEENIADSDIARRLDILSDKTNEIIERSESGTASDESLREVSDEIAEIKDSLFTDYEKIKEDITFIRNQIELNVEEADAETQIELGDEDFTAILEDLAEIKEKLAAADEYDVMAEILSLREDMKAARLSSGTGDADELEKVKTDISEQNELLLEEIKGLRNDLSGIPVNGTGIETATGDELNMVLNEIVSLRDEIQSYKDELNSRTVITESETVSDADEEVALGAVPNEDFGVILDELTDMRSELAGYKEETRELHAEEIEPLKTGLDNLSDSLAELKDMISRRTTVSTEVSASGEETVSGSGLDVVLNEIVDLKQDFERELQALKDSMSVEEHSVTGEGSVIESSDKYNELLSAIESLRENRVAVESDEGALDVLSELLLLHSEINDIRHVLDGSEHVGTGSDAISEYSDVLSELNDIKEQLAGKEVIRTEVEPDDGIREELAAIRELLNERRSESSSEELQMLRDEIAGLRQELVSRDYSDYGDSSANSEIVGLREEIASLKEQLAATHETEREPDMSVMTEIMSLREEIASLKEQISVPRTVGDSDESDMTVLTEVMALRDEISELKAVLGSPDADMAETVAQIREDVRIMKDEPDLSALNEVLALRDEFQAMKDEIAGRNTDEEVSKSDEEILSEVQSLRDQLFAISMANVNDGSGDKVTYESYNNIILDEITALREELNAYKTSDSAREVMEEIAEIKRSIAAQTADESELMTQLSKLKNDLEALKNSEEKDATNNAILSELANLKTELTNQREADLTTLNFMSEMAHLIERQNQYINQSANSKITDEIESLKAEIASSLAAPSVETSAIMSEIAKLKEELSQDSGNNVDNRTILNELAKLKDEISAEKPSDQNAIVLEEIARLKDEISLLSEKNASDKDVSVEEISQSINDLKNELTQIADIVGDEEKPKKTAKSTTTRRQTTKSSGSKSGGAKKTRSTSAKSSSTRSASKKTSSAKKSNTATKKSSEQSTMSSDELLSKIEAVSIDIPQNTETGESDFNVNLDLNYVPDKGQDELDIASKLAKQVANKLIMEQLVEQLGNGGVPENEVEEIVKDILPQEFSTVMIEEQSDQVRRLANSLVLDKLRARLTGRKDDEE